jgi:hypothetical protein
MALEALIPLKARTGIVALTFAGGTNVTHAGWRCSMPIRLSLTLVILIVCTTWYAWAQSVPQKNTVHFQNSISVDVAVSSVDSTSKQESLIGNVPAGGAPLVGNALPGTEFRVRLARQDAWIGTYITTDAPEQIVNIGWGTLPAPGTVPNRPAQPIPASSFAESCKNIWVTADELYADCYRADGSTLNRSSIRIRGIRNRNSEGNLYFVGMDEPSSFQYSCSGMRVAGNTLEADCKRSDGRYNKTSILIPGIVNNNGVLVYEGWTSPTPQPTPIRCSAEQANRCRIDRDQCLAIIISARSQLCHDSFRQCLSAC